MTASRRPKVSSLKLIKVPSHNSAVCFANPRGRLADFRFAHPDITAIIWDFPAKNPKISLRETSDNRDVMSNCEKALNLEI